MKEEDSAVGRRMSGYTIDYKEELGLLGRSWIGGIHALLDILGLKYFCNRWRRLI